MGIYSAEAFDAANTIIQELKILASHKGGTKNITRQNVVNGLHHILYHGLTKTIKFKSNGNISGTDIYVNQVQGGQVGPTRPHVVTASTSEKSRALRHAGCPAFFHHWVLGP